MTPRSTGGERRQGWGSPAPVSFAWSWIYGFRKHAFLIYDVKILQWFFVQMCTIEEWNTILTICGLAFFFFKFSPVTLNSTLTTWVFNVTLKIPTTISSSKADLIVGTLFLRLKIESFSHLADFSTKIQLNHKQWNFIYSFYLFNCLLSLLELIILGFTPSS